MKITKLLAPVMILGFLAAGLPAKAQVADVIFGINLGARLLSRAARHQEQVHNHYYQEDNNGDTYEGSYSGHSNRHYDGDDSYAGHSSHNQQNSYRAESNARRYSYRESGYATENKAISLYNKGVKAYKNDNYESAISSFQAALEINPEMELAHGALGCAYERLHDYEHAMPELEMQLKMGPRDAQTYFVAGNVALNLHNYELSNTLFNRFLKKEGSGEQVEFARKVTAILDHDYFHKADGDYFADATKNEVRRWQNGGKPLKVFIAESPELKGYKPEFPGLLKDAFAEWSKGSAGKIKFEFTKVESEAQISCAWTDDRSTLGSSQELGLTHTTMDEDGTILKAKIDLYTLIDDPHRTPEQILTTARNVDLHEIGHALGLQHSESVYDIMFATVFPDGLSFPLTARDTSTLVAIYSTPDIKSLAGTISTTKQSVGSLLVFDDHDKDALKNVTPASVSK